MNISKISTRSTNVTNDNTFAFVLGFASVMPQLSHQLYSLDTENIEALVAKILTFQLNSNHHGTLSKIKNTLALWRMNIAAPSSAFIEYRRDYLEYIRDSMSHSAGFYNFVLSVCKQFPTQRKNGVKLTFNDVLENDKNKWGIRCIYYRCPSNSMHAHITGKLWRRNSRALRRFQLKIRVLSREHSKSAFYDLGQKLARCYAVKEYEIEYQAALMAYCSELYQAIIKQGRTLNEKVKMKMDEMCNSIKTLLECGKRALKI